MILTINGKQAALKKGSSIEYVSDYATKGGYIVSPKNPLSIKQESKDLKGTIARLNERLDEPFVTVNTVTGDKGIKQAQDEYQRLMNNKSPKSKRK